MLAITRRKDESIKIDLRKLTANQLATMQANGAAVIEVTALSFRGDRVMLGIDACPLIPVHRGELFNRIEEKAK